MRGINEDQVRFIRSLGGRQFDVGLLAKCIDVNPGVIYDVINHRTFKHISGESKLESNYGDFERKDTFDVG